MYQMSWRKCLNVFFFVSILCASYQMRKASSTVCLKMYCCYKRETHKNWAPKTTNKKRKKNNDRIVDIRSFFMFHFSSMLNFYRNTIVELHNCQKCYGMAFSVVWKARNCVAFIMNTSKERLSTTENIYTALHIH